MSRFNYPIFRKISEKGILRISDNQFKVKISDFHTKLLRKQKVCLVNLPHKFSVLLFSTVLSITHPVIAANSETSPQSSVNRPLSGLHTPNLSPTYLDESANSNSVSSNCENDCDDIDATANVTAAEEIDDEAIIIDDEDIDSVNKGISIEIEDVPLNTISPQTIASFVEIIDVVRSDFLRPVNDEELFDHAIRGMLEKIDSHADYLSQSSYENLRKFTDGEIGQVGLSVKYRPEIGYWVIRKVASRSSAKRAGVKVGDKLVRIKRAELTPDMHQEDIEQLLAGIAGSQVQVTIIDSKGKTKNISLQRNLSTNNKLDVEVKNSIAVIKIPVFQNASRNQLIEALKNSGEPITGVVLDIRNNPGGVLASAIDIVSLFVEEGGLIEVSHRTNNIQVLKPRGTPYLSDLPVAVIQNRYSASAAEVLSSSLKSNKRAEVVGENSFGKGTVQEVLPLQSGGALKLTVAEYRSISGEKIDGVGISPDLYFSNDGEDWQDKAVKLLLTKDRPVGIKFDDELNGISVIDDY